MKLIGIINLLGLLLVTSGVHKALVSLHQNGFVIGDVYDKIMQSGYLSRVENYQTMAALAGMVIFTAFSYWIEILATTRCPRAIVFSLIFINLSALLAYPVICSFKLQSHPGAASYLLLFATVTFLKLVSFHHVYHDTRYLVKQIIAAKRNNQTIEPSLVEGTIFGISKSVYDEALTYPKCLTIEKFIRFFIGPTCCYQISYPLIDNVRPKRVLKHFL